MFCPKCGAQLADTAKFCYVCGASMEAVAPAAPQAPVVPATPQAPQAPVAPPTPPVSPVPPTPPIPPAPPVPPAPVYNDGYQYDPYAPAEASKKKSKKGLVLGLSIGGGVLLIGIVVLILWLTGAFGGGSSAGGQAPGGESSNSGFFGPIGTESSQPDEEPNSSAVERPLDNSSAAEDVPAASESEPESEPVIPDEPISKLPILSYHGGKFAHGITIPTSGDLGIGEDTRYEQNFLFFMSSSDGQSWLWAEDPTGTGLGRVTAWCTTTDGTGLDNGPLVGDSISFFTTCFPNCSRIPVEGDAQYLQYFDENGVALSESEADTVLSHILEGRVDTPLDSIYMLYVWSKNGVISRLLFGDMQTYCDITGMSLEDIYYMGTSGGDEPDEPVTEMGFFVNDFDDLLDPAMEEELNSYANYIYESYGVEVVSLTVPSLEGSDPGEYAEEFYMASGYGDDGILLLLSMNDGYWHVLTSGVMTEWFPVDAIVEIIEARVIPYVADGNFEDAFYEYMMLAEEICEGGGLALGGGA